MTKRWPSSVLSLPIPKTPALLTKISSLFWVSLISLATLRTESNDAKFKVLAVTFGLPDIRIISLIATLPFFSFWLVIITFAPLLAKSKAVANPMPKNKKYLTNFFVV